MDSGDEMMIHQFIEEEDISILMALLQLQADEDAAPILGGS
jgi:hypothetical protein